MYNYDVIFAGFGYYMAGPIIELLYNLALFILHYFGIVMYKFDTLNTFNIFKSHILYTSSLSDSDIIDGYVIGKNFIGHACGGDSMSRAFNKCSSMKIITTRKFLIDNGLIKNKNNSRNILDEIKKADILFNIMNDACKIVDENDLTDSIDACEVLGNTYDICEKYDANDGHVSNKKNEIGDILNERENATVELWYRVGSYNSIGYHRTNIQVTKIPRNDQQQIINSIIKGLYNKSNLSVLIHGKSGSGKSMIPLFLAKQLNYCVTNSYNPTEPGDFLQPIISRSEAAINKKMIVVLDEVDILIKKIHDDNIAKHKNIPIEVKNKTDWNLLMDKIDNEIYQNIVFILISNEPIEYFNSLDQSYMRSGRINQIHELNLDKIDKID